MSVDFFHLDLFLYNSIWRQGCTDASIRNGDTILFYFYSTALETRARGIEPHSLALINKSFQLR